MKHNIAKSLGQIRHKKSCKISANHNSGISNIHTYVDKKYVIYKNLISVASKGICIPIKALLLGSVYS